MVPSDPSPLAELTPRPDGGWSFRLLQTSLPSLVVADLTVTLVDAKLRIVRSGGHATEVPAATIEAARGADHQSLQLTLGVPQTALGHTLVLDDLSDGSLPGLPRQFAARLSLDRR